MFRVIKRGAVWWYRGTIHGVEVFKSTKCRDRKAADLFVRKLERELADPHHAAAHQATIASAATRFLKEVRNEGLADGTINMYECKTGHVVRLMGHIRLYDLEASHTQKFIDTRREETAEPYTIHRELTALRRVLKSAAKAREFDRDPKSVIPKYGTKYVPRKRWLTSAELWAVMYHLDAGRAAMIAYAVATASDLGALNRARREDVQPKFVSVRGTKTESRPRTVPRVVIFSRLLEFAIANADGEDGKLFRPWSNMRRDIAAACKRADIDPFTAIDLRRTAATWLVRADVPLNVVAKFMGHGSTAMLEKVYGQLDAESVGHIIERRTARMVHGTSAKVTEREDVEDRKISEETA